MKVGILTFHNAHNYGASLQAYALKMCIQQMGHDVTIVNYRCGIPLPTGCVQNRRTVSPKIKTKIYKKNFESEKLEAVCL